MTSIKTKIHLLTAVALAASLTGCGGGADPLNSAVSDATTSTVEMALISAADAESVVVPFVTNLNVAEPLAVDVDNPSVSALLPPVQQTVKPLAGEASTVVTYTPAQIRAAYQLPALPASWTNLTAAQAASMGAGQTIYIIGTKHNPNIAAELAAFNQKFGLPNCTTVAIPTNAALPLAAAKAANGCQLSVVYSDGAGMTSTAPEYDWLWAVEMTLDVQWAHATAPLARIVLIEATESSVIGLTDAINLANTMGPGVVSMSFGTPEGAWVNSMDSVFSAANMTYAAGTGDSGARVEWPSASSRVLAVGGTSLNSYTATSRNETTWSSTGGGVSQYFSVPSYQSATVPGLGFQTQRNAADVAFNADPSTGQFIAVIKPGTTTPEWFGVGGTSLATPQWAGLVAVANATRAQKGLGPMGMVQNLIYKATTTTSNFFSTIFADITSGNNGGFTARAFYDQPTGLGSPNATNFVSLAAGGSTPPVSTPPTVTAVTVNGVVGTPVSFSMAYTSPDPVTWSLTGAPKGMTISTAGLISWPTPAAGTYKVTVKATDTITKLAGSAVATIVVAKPVAPVVSAASVTGQAGTALSYQVSAQSTNPAQFALTGTKPSGLSISSTGLISWAKPVVGTYKLTVKATDSKTSLSGSAVITLQISAAPPVGPVVKTSPLNGTAGKKLTGVVGFSDPGAAWFSVTIKGAPAGMTFAQSGSNINLTWENPVRGTYTLVFTCTDNLGRTGQGTMVITIK